MKCLKYQKRFVQLVNKNTIATFSVKCNVILNVTYKWSISFQYHFKKNWQWIKRCFKRNVYFCIYYDSGIQKVGIDTRWGTIASRSESHSRSAILFELRANMVRIDETRGCVDENTKQRTFTGSHKSVGPPVQQRRLCQGLQLSLRLTDESNPKVQRLVSPSNSEEKRKNLVTFDIYKTAREILTFDWILDEIINCRYKSPHFVTNVAGNDKMIERRGIFKWNLCNNWKLWCLVLCADYRIIVYIDWVTTMGPQKTIEFYFVVVQLWRE